MREICFFQELNLLLEIEKPKMAMCTVKHYYNLQF